MSCNNNVADKLTTETVIGKSCSGKTMYAGDTFASCDDISDDVIDQLAVKDGTLTATTVDKKVVETDLPAVIAGDNVTVTKSGEDYEVSAEQKQLCSLSEISVASAQGASDAYIIGCVDGEEKKIPLDIIPDVPESLDCIPTTLSAPSGEPSGAPFALGCGGSFYVYTCEGEWVEISSQASDNATLDPADVSDICESLKLNVHYEAGDCATFREVSLEDFAELLDQCHNFGGDVVIEGDNVTTTTTTDDDGNTVITVSIDTDQATLTRNGSTITVTNEDDTSSSVDAIAGIKAGDNVTVTENADGTVTVSADDAPTATGGDGTTATTNPDGTVSIELDLCSLDNKTVTEVNDASEAYIAACVDGEQVKYPKETVVEGTGTTVTTDPDTGEVTVSMDVCGVDYVASPDTSKTTILACVDGVPKRVPYPTTTTTTDEEETELQWSTGAVVADIRYNYGDTNSQLSLSLGSRGDTSGDHASGGPMYGINQWLSLDVYAHAWNGSGPRNYNLASTDPVGTIQVRLVPFTDGDGHTTVGLEYDYDSSIFTLSGNSTQLIVMDAWNDSTLGDLFYYRDSGGNVYDSIVDWTNNNMWHDLYWDGSMVSTADGNEVTELINSLVELPITIKQSVLDALPTTL